MKFSCFIYMGLDHQVLKDKTPINGYVPGWRKKSIGIFDIESLVHDENMSTLGHVYILATHEVIELDAKLSLFERIPINIVTHSGSDLSPINTLGYTWITDYTRATRAMIEAEREAFDAINDIPF